MFNAVERTGHAESEANLPLRMSLLGTKSETTACLIEQLKAIIAKVF